ncbi:MAG: metalloregulator ArsR/SmtB family transcription factor [Bryobacteraceae bacterium]|nr:metalloregulator ArsR/SmtB family transcription factor [Bryobacteraceae bacterium]
MNGLKLQRCFAAVAAITKSPKRKPDDSDEHLYHMQVQICKAFANATRLKMLDLLGGGKRSVAELQERLGVTAANLSQHLGILRAAGVVRTERTGRRLFCSLAMPEVKSACELLRDVLRARQRKGRNLTI